MAASKSAGHNNGDSTALSDKAKQDKPRPDATGIVGKQPDADIEPGQQPLEKPSTVGPDAPQQDPKLVSLCCFHVLQLKI